jgi:outer membrane receptor protein involved in Fe transport
MNKLSLLGSSALRSALLIGVTAAAATPAFAQSSTTPPPDQTTTSTTTTPQTPPTSGDATNQSGTTDATGEKTIYITGSRIRRPDLESTVPVAILRSEDIYESANPNVGETLNNLPQLRSTFAQQNPGLGIGIAGLNLLDLRGLGVRRTLVLVNGRRHVPSDLQNSAAAVDINSIPTELIERVDIVTGGNSAVYGSDAIAGVVNFILKDHFDGFEIRGGDSIPQYGRGGNQYISAIAGKNFGGGRGNITLAAEYTHQQRLFGSDVPWLSKVNGFVTVDADPAGTPNGSDGVPDAIFVHDIHSSTISRFGVVSILENNNANAPCGKGIPNPTAQTNYSCDFIFGAGGQLVPLTGVRLGTGPNGSFIGGNGDNNREDRLLSILPKNNRINVNLLGHYTFSDAATLFVEAKYSRARTTGSNSGPAFDQGTGVTFADARANIRLDNPFLDPVSRQLIIDQVVAGGGGTGLVAQAPLTAAQLAARNAAIANGSFRFVVAKNFTDLGIRDEDALRETYRFVVGLRGNLTPHVNYEISANYGRANEKIQILGNVNVQRLLLALDAGRDPATGQIKCRSQFDPASATAVRDVNGAATLASDIAACVPYNPFGAPNNAAARNYIVDNSGDHGHLIQKDVTAFVSADSGGFFRLPGGPIAVVLGGEWRHEDAFFTADPNVQAGLTFENSLQTFNPPAQQVTEGFGEINIPILKSMPFFESLTLSGAARVSHYNKAYGSTGTVWAWNFGGEWAPIRDIRFRANYGKAVRAPNYTETAAPLVQNFANGFLDPCHPSRIGAGTPARITNCQAALGNILNDPQFLSFTSLATSLEIRSGSNPLLTAETSKSLTIGAVITPRFLPGFDATIDYYDIVVHNVISAASAQTIVNLCYDTGQFCNLFQRNGSGTGPKGEVPGQILQGSLIQSGLNFAALKRRGIDVQVTYNHKFNADTRLNLRAYYTHQLRNSNFTNPTDALFESRLLDQLGDPKDEAVLNADLTVGKFTFGYGAHYVGKMLNTAYANIYSINGNPPANADAVDILYFPNVLYHNVRFSVQLGSTAENRKGFQWFFGVDNLADKHPPLGSSAVGSGSAIYDIRGRTYFSGFRATF